MSLDVTPTRRAYLAAPELARRALTMWPYMDTLERQTVILTDGAVAREELPISTPGGT